MSDVLDKLPLRLLLRPSGDPETGPYGFWRESLAALLAERRRDRARAVDYEPTFVGIDLGHEASVSLVWKRRPDGTVEIISASPIEELESRTHAIDEIARRYSIPEEIMRPGPWRFEVEVEAMRRGMRRFDEELTLRLSVDSRRMARGFRRLRLRVDQMRIELADRRSAGSGQELLQGAIYNAFHDRAVSFGVSWHEAAERYADLQDMHLALYGERWPRPTPDQAAPF